MAAVQDFAAGAAAILPDLVPYLALIWLFAAITAAVRWIRTEPDDLPRRHSSWFALWQLLANGGALTLFLVASDAQSRDMISLQTFIGASIVAWLAGTAPYWAVRS